MKTLRVAAVQFRHQPGDKTSNLAVIAKFVERAAEQDVKVIAFPECCISGYWHLRKLSREELAALAEPVPNGAAAQSLLALAKSYDMTIGAGLVEIDDSGRLYNSYFVAMPDGR